jgi:hypothetical protein
MITYQREILFDVIEEVDSLLHLHYEELTLHRDKVKLAPMWDRYADLERCGNFIVFTVRDGERLIGYSAFFLNQHLHYGELTIAVNDVLYLHPDYRSGRVGLKLIRMCESHFESMKSDNNEIKIVWHAKLDTKLQQLLGLMKYKAEEIVFGKIL